jgi:hypothetical protein
MYDIILDALIDDMKNFGMISTIIISQDYYYQMSKKQINHLDSFLTDGLKWLIVNDRKEYWSFIYSSEPFEFEYER